MRHSIDFAPTEEQINDAVAAMSFGEKRQRYLDWETACYYGRGLGGFREWLAQKVSDDIERQKLRDYTDWTMRMCA